MLQEWYWSGGKEKRQAQFTHYDYGMSLSGAVDRQIEVHERSVPAGESLNYRMKKCDNFSK